MTKKSFVFVVVLLLAVVFSLLISMEKTRVILLQVYTYLTIGDSPSEVEKIFILNENGQWAECPDPPAYGSCYVQPTPDSVESVSIRIQVYDENGDCHQSVVNVYVCKNETGSICNAGNADPDGGSPTVNFLTQSPDTLRCNFTATYGALRYFKKYGIWRINATTRDPNRPEVNSIVKAFLNSMVPSLTYPYPSGNSIFLGDITLDSWNENRGANVTRNTGNVRLNISWLSTNFTCPTCSPPASIIIDNVNERYCIDNDQNRADGCGYFNAISLTPVWWYPDDGIRRCGVQDCNQDEDPADGNQANFTLYYHIYVISPKAAGNYNNTLTLNINWCDPPNVPCGSGHWS